MIGGIILDIVIIVIALMIVIVGKKRGFFRSFMSLVSGFASVFIAYTFTPALSGILKEKFFLGKLSGSVAKTFASICENGEKYDVTKLIGNSQFDSVVERYGADSTKITKVIDGIKDTSYKAVEKVSDAVADKIAGTLSTVAAFILILVVSVIVLKIITHVIGLLFKLPVLRTFDRGLGFIFGIVSALLFVFVMSEISVTLWDILVSVAPDTFKTNIAESSILVKAVSEFDIIDFFAQS